MRPGCAQVRAGTDDGSSPPQARRPPKREERSLIRHLAHAKLQELRQAGLTYHEIARRYGSTNGFVSPAASVELRLTDDRLQRARSAGWAEQRTRDAAVFLRTLDALEPTTSMGGARPKNTVEDDAGLWVAKFPARGDRWNNAAVEAGMLRLAARCDIRVPETRIERLGEEFVLLLRRFDRQKVEGGYYRHRMASALTLLDAAESPTDRTTWSYLLLADELQRWSSRPREDKVELFRRVVFNALISNNDDHPRNHAVVAASSDWRLAPAYDLTPSPQLGREERDLALVCGRFGTRATRQNLLSAAPRFGLTHDDASAVIDDIVNIVRRYWRTDVFAQAGTEADCAAIEPAFVHEGFEYEISP